ncbi:hypothetical protein MPSEU_000996300 [Mayamaea pseudoterrestris]|nr:hypothetical protein MPSEU_000996300 [Mayamaea pseudoterrestris]
MSESFTVNQPKPRLYANLQLALSSLYSLPAHPGSSVISPSKAHEYLMHLQSRNVRRRIHAIQQSYRDQLHDNHQALPSAQQSIGQQQLIYPHQQNYNSHQNQQSFTAVEMGSSWLACLFLLVSAQTTTEQLFCAQTLLHRIRRSRLTEAIDWEVEHPHDCTEKEIVQMFQSIDLLRISDQYCHAIRQLHPFVGAVLDSSPVSRSSMTLTANDEERLKGELTLLTVASLLYLLLSHAPSLNDGDSSHSSGVSPIASTLGAVVATLALRLRYAVALTEQQHSLRTIFTTITDALSVVWNAATSLDGSDGSGNARAFVVAMHACLSSVPDTVMGGMQTSGARGRLSMDPKCLQAAMAEVRCTGMQQLWDTVRHVESIHGSSVPCDTLLLDTCTQWAKFLPLTNEFLEYLSPRINKYLTGVLNRHRQLVMGLIIAVFDCGTWTVGDVLARSLGLSEQQQMQQLGKKKQSNKTKKRNNARIGSNATDKLAEEAAAEVHCRGELACSLAIQIWEHLKHVINQQIVSLNADLQAPVDGEGSIGCLVSAANACLPHVVQNTHIRNAKELVSAIVAPLQELCRSTNKSVRALVMEALWTLHCSVVTSGPIEREFEEIIVDNLCACAMGLAAACGYPSDYFVDLGAVNDEDLEIERNDVRDLVRTISGSTAEMAKSVYFDEVLSTKVLVQLVGACKDAASLAYMNRHLCAESIVHMFSALAKPINQILVWASGAPSSLAMHLTLTALETLCLMCKNTLAAFDQPFSVQVILPVCRTVNIAVCSLSPFLAGFCVPCSDADQRSELVKEITKSAVMLAAFSIDRLPELAARSPLGRHCYDIRGAMRGPGGEDHVGCLALMRLVNETSDLTQTVINGSSDFIPQLCNLHRKLQMIETQRGQGVWHGSGVTPKSRRILLSVLCRLEVAFEGVTASTMLGDLFHSAVNAIASHKRTSLDHRVIYEICEAIHDIGTFPSGFIRSLFEASSVNQRDCLEAITRACLEGYWGNPIGCDHDASCRQWNRLRAALFYLLTSFGTVDVPDRASEMIQKFIQAECMAINRQCGAGPYSQSSIFCEEVVSESFVPAGVFVRCFSEIIRPLPASPTNKRINSATRTLNGVLEQQDVDNAVTYSKAIQTMYLCREVVIASVRHTCPEPHSNAFIDPRPVVLEAWLLAMVDLMELNIPESLLFHVKVLLTETLATVVSLLLYPTLKRTEDRSDDPGMSFDGPQSLAIMEFLSHCLALPMGLEILDLTAAVLSKSLSLDFGVLGSDADGQKKGEAMIAASLFRAVQGGLPPWAVEFIPDVYASFYAALDRDAVAFGMVLRLAMDVRLPLEPNVSFGGLQPGKLVAGRYFESLSSQAKDKFAQEAMVLASTDDLASWRRLKMLIKAACGGKKKDSGFQLKPSLTRWDFDRI